MAEIDTSVYRSLGQNNDPLKQPLAIMQLLGAINQNKLQNMDISGKQGIADVYSRSPFPAADEIARAAGIHAPAAVAQSVQNTTNKFGLDTSQTKYLQETLAPLGAKKDLKDIDVEMWTANVVRNGISPTIIGGVLNDIYRAKTPDAKRNAILNHGVMSMGTGGLEGTPGAPDEAGRISDVPKAQAIFERATGVQPRVTTNPPGFDTAATGSATLFSNARTRASNYGSDVFPMLEALPALERLGTKGTGPGTEELNTIKSFIQSNLSWLPGSDKIIGDPNKIKDFDEAKKYLTNMAGARAGAFGHGTDQALSTALTASPNTHISNLAATDLTKATIALRRMEQAQTLEADTKKVNPGNFATWAARWATDVDPRAFMVDLMTPDQLEKLNKTLKNPKERSKFNQSVKRAIDAGVITRPGGERTPGE